METRVRTTAGHVVVGVNESPPSWAALHWAAKYAALTHAELRVVHVFVLEPTEMYGSTAGLREEIRRDARVLMTELVTEILGPPSVDVSWRLAVEEGAPGRVLVDASRQAALLVLGTGEHAGVRRLVSGSVSHYCLSHAHGPVAAVPMGARPSAGGHHEASREASAGR